MFTIKGPKHKIMLLYYRLSIFNIFDEYLISFYTISKNTVLFCRKANLQVGGGGGGVYSEVK